MAQHQARKRFGQHFLTDGAVIDQIVAGLRSACTYAGASSIEEFHERAVVGVQSAAGYDEGRPLGTSW